MPTSQKFKEEYAKLNAKQKEAVDTIEGPVMVIAGPGTGKTTILTLRIANILLKTDTPPSGILSLTFTEAGTKAMREKLKGIIGERAFEVPIHTFHGFAASVLAEFSDHFPHLSRSRQITDIESEALIRDILKDKKFAKLRPGGEPDFYVSKILSAISDSKQEAWTPEMLKSFAKDEMGRIEEDPESISSRGATRGKLKGEALKRIEKSERTLLFADVYEEYEKRKREERKIDFDDLIFELLKTLKRDELLLQILQERFLYILVDEHQDTNDSQNEIVRLLSSFFENPNLFVVGDEKQAIYRFQGASVENFLAFQKIWIGMKVISLTQNYRSHQSILDASFKMIEQNYGKGEYSNLRVKLQTGSKMKAAPLELIEAPDIYTEEWNLVQKLKKISSEEPGKTAAVIVRRNSDVSKIFSLLEEHNIPASAERGANIFSHPLGETFFSLLEFLADPSQTESLAQTFVGGLWNLDFAKQAELLKLIRSGKTEEITKAIPQIQRLVKEIPHAGAIGSLIMAADLSGFTELASETPLGAEIWRGIICLAQEIAQTRHTENPQELMGELLAYKKSAERRSIKIKTGKSDAQITVMTAHGSKGLEFDYVFLPYAVEEVWINKARASFFVLPKEKEEGDNIRDERRLFYVGLTRARGHVALSYSLEDDAGKILTPLRFLDELDTEHLNKKVLQKTEERRGAKTIEALESKRDKEKVEYAKSEILEKGLSVSALNVFLNCPSEFFYKCILKLPEPPNPLSEKGNAMHEAIANVWRELRGNPTHLTGTLPLIRGGKTENKTDIEKILIASIKNYFSHSLLPIFEKEAVLEELTQNAPIVASALESHFSQPGTVYTERWFDAPFLSALASTSENKEEKININLHGRLDAVVETEKELLVFDYKTRAAMSVAAIKGETKSSERMNGGSYFRQLVFYKMLLEGNARYADKNILPALVFVKPDDKGRCPTISIEITKEDVQKVESEITTLLESVWSGSFLTSTCSNLSCKFCSLKKLAV